MKRSENGLVPVCTRGDPLSHIVRVEDNGF